MAYLLSVEDPNRNYGKTSLKRREGGINKNSIIFCNTGGFSIFNLALRNEACWFGDLQ